jgi:hypothetical protein
MNLKGDWSLCSKRNLMVDEMRGVYSTNGIDKKYIQNFGR